jgi:hypothetical protein
MLTRYELYGAARFIPRFFFINHVISAMHRVVINDMQIRLAPRPAIARSDIECQSATLAQGNG